MITEILNYTETPENLQILIETLKNILKEMNNNNDK